MSLSKGDLESYIKTHYTADRFVIAGAGAINHSELAELSEKHFNQLPKGPADGAVALGMEPAIFTGSDKRIRFDSMKEAHVALAFQVGPRPSLASVAQPQPQPLHLFPPLP